MGRGRGTRGSEFVAKQGDEPKGTDAAGRELFRYPDGWKEEARNGVTLETRIPENPRGEELLPRPSIETLRRELDAIQSGLEALTQERQSKREAKRARMSGLKEKSRGTADVLKEKRELKRSKYTRPLAELKEQKQALITELAAFEEKVASAKAKMGGKAISKETLKRLIQERTDEYNSKQYTATEEERVLQAIEKLKNSLAYAGLWEESKRRRDEVRTKLDGVSAQIAALKAEMQPIKMEIAKLEQSNKETENGMRTQDTLITNIENDVEKINHKCEALVLRRRQLNDEYREKLYAYQKQRFEILRLEEMRKYQTHLRAIERRKKEAENALLDAAKERERQRERLRFKYQSEIALCDRLTAMLEGIIRSRVSAPTAEPIAAPAIATVASTEEPMPLLIGKKGLFKEEEAPVVRKQQRRKKNIENRRRPLFEDYTVVMLFDQLKILAPDTVEEASNTIKVLQAKKEQFLKMREDEIIKAIAQSESAEPQISENISQSIANDNQYISEEPAASEVNDRKAAEVKA